MLSTQWVYRILLVLLILHCPIAVPAIPTSNSYSKKTQSNNAENKRPEEETGRKACSTAKVPASPLPGLDRKKTTPAPSTVSHEPPSGPLIILAEAWPLAIPELTVESGLQSNLGQGHPSGSGEESDWTALASVRQYLPSISHRTASSPPAQTEAGTPHFWTGPALGRPPSRMVKTGESLDCFSCSWGSHLTVGSDTCQ